jgi:hypothetical protein
MAPMQTLSGAMRYQLALLWLRWVPNRCRHGRGEGEYLQLDGTAHLLDLTLPVGCHRNLRPEMLFS